MNNNITTIILIIRTKLPQFVQNHLLFLAITYDTFRYLGYLEGFLSVKISVITHTFTDTCRIETLTPKSKFKKIIHYLQMHSMVR